MAMRRLWNERSRRASCGTDPDHGRSPTGSGWLAGCAPCRTLRVVAAFDVDGTLTTRDCVVPFLRRVAGTAGLRRRSRPPQPSSSLPAAGSAAIETASRSSPRASCSPGGGSTRSTQAGRQFAAHVAVVVAPRRHASRRCVDIVDDGHHVVLVSASYDVYLVPLAEQPRRRRT